MLRPLAGHLGCLRALNIWLLDLAADARAPRVLEQVLQARAALCCHRRCGRPPVWGMRVRVSVLSSPVSLIAKAGMSRVVRLGDPSLRLLLRLVASGGRGGRQVLQMMPVQWGALKQSGVAATVRQRAAEHPARSVRAAVAAVTQRWAAAAGDASLAVAPPPPAGAGSGAGLPAPPPARADPETPSPSEEVAEVLDEGVRQRLAEAEAVRRLDVLGNCLWYTLTGSLFAAAQEGCACACMDSLPARSCAAGRGSVRARGTWLTRSRAATSRSQRPASLRRLVRTPGGAGGGAGGGRGGAPGGHWRRRGAGRAARHPRLHRLHGRAGPPAPLARGQGGEAGAPESAVRPPADAPLPCARRAARSHAACRLRMGTMP